MALGPARRFPLEMVVVLLLEPCSGSSWHSLRYVYVGVSEPSQGLPQFFTVGYLDDQAITLYDSLKKEKVPLVSWMREVEKEDPEYWDEGSKILQATQQVFRDDLKNVQSRYKQKGGLHTWQAAYGCELRGDGSKGGYSQYGYDGKTFLTFDKETLSWVATDPQAQITQRNWDANLQWSQRNKFYLEEECIEWLEKYLSYGNKTLLRTEAPVVTVSSRTEADDGMETHVCRVDGFYPKEIDASWRRDGEVWTQDTLRGSVAPNADGTYHYWLSIRIDPKERGRYRCHVEHGGLQEPLNVALEDLCEIPGSNLGHIVGCVVAATLVLVAVISGILAFRKKFQDGYKAASTKRLPPFLSFPASDKGSNSSYWGSNSAV